MKLRTLKLRTLSLVLIPMLNNIMLLLCFYLQYSKIAYSVDGFKSFRIRNCMLSRTYTAILINNNFVCHPYSSDFLECASNRTNLKNQKTLDSSMYVLFVIVNKLLKGFSFGSNFYKMYTYHIGLLSNRIARFIFRVAHAIRIMALSMLF
jgi:hypothetical protein